MKDFKMAKNKKLYEIIRFYQDSSHPDNGKLIDSYLTLEEAKKHCNDPNTSESGVWFDGFQEM